MRKHRCLISSTIKTLHTNTRTVQSRLVIEQTRLIINALMGDRNRIRNLLWLPYFSYLFEFDLRCSNQGRRQESAEIVAD